MSDWWNVASLDDLTPQQWEALCDGCGRCCLHKFQDIDSGHVSYTAVRCRYLDDQTCRCTDYSNRLQLVADCIQLDREKTRDFEWLPPTCAYRLRSRGESLPYWHPLVSGDVDTVHAAGISVRGRAISDEYVHPESYDEHIVNWVE